MAKKKKVIRLSVCVLESEDKVNLKLEIEGGTVLQFVSDNLPSVRVIGFNRLMMTREQLIERARREASYGFQNGEVGFLRKYIRDRENEINRYVLELRKIMRKIAASEKVAKEARAALEVLGHEQRSSQP